MRELIGRTIRAVYPDINCIIFSTDDGGYAYRTEGDCCSHSWFSGIQGMEALIGGKVSLVSDCLLDERDNEDGYECLKIYGINITTDKGRAVVEFRNSSNGYYGGWCEFAGKCVVDQTLIPATDDWDAR